MMYSSVSGWYVDAYQVSMGFRGYFWMAKRVLKFPAKIKFSSETCWNLLGRSQTSLDSHSS